MNKLTKRQEEVLDCIRRHIDNTGMPPTRAQLAASLGFKSINAAEQHIKALARKGAIELLKGASRGIRLIGEYIEEGLPVIGRVAAGQPILAEEHIETHYKVLPDMFHPPAHYLLRVQGESMRDAGILDGDLLAVHRTPEAHNGQIVVARVDKEEATVKRFRKDGNIVWLLPENDEFEPIKIDLEHRYLEIEGLGVGIIRNRSDL